MPGILPNYEIAALGIVSPCLARTSEKYRLGGLGREISLSHGISYAGYDVRLDDLTSLSPGHSTLASTMERFILPKNVIGRVTDKSTLARLGIQVQNTVLEPGWRGYLTLEITCCEGSPWMLPRGCPIAQVIFEEMKDYPEGSYEGKYQDQDRGPQHAI